MYSGHIAAVLLALVFVSHVGAQSSIGTYQSYRIQEQTLILKGNSGEVRMSLIAEGIMRVVYDAGQQNAKAPTRSIAIQPSSIDTWSIAEGDNRVIASSHDWLVVLSDRSNPKLIFIYDGDTLLQEIKPAQTLKIEGTSFAEISFRSPPNERFYGTGARALPQNLRGQQLEMYNQAHYGYANGTPNLNICIPWVASSEGYGVYFDTNHPAKLDFAFADKTAWTYTLEASEDLPLYLVAGTLQELPSLYASLTGHQPLPPRWALGFIQSRYGYETEEQARNMVDSLIQGGFPLDGLVLDLFWFGDSHRMGDLDWDRDRFPSPEKMMADFAAQGVKTIPIIEPYFTRESSNFGFLAERGWFAKKTDGTPYVIEDFWTGGNGAALLDLYNEETHDWFWEFFKARIDEGAAAWWCDLGEPETHPEEMMHTRGGARISHNDFSLVWAELLYQKYQEEYPHVRLFNLIRSGYGGMQRYGTFPWSGDISRSWSGLQAQIPLLLNMGISGVAYMGSDLGGFTGGEQNDELYTRWLQFGAFSPVMRAHGAGGIPSEPIYYSEQTQNIVRDFIKLRYQLLPYNYHLSFENTKKGTPLARPIWMYDPVLAESYGREDEYLWGKDFLVAPILEGGVTARDVTFPAGTWVSWWDGTAYQGGTTVSVEAPIHQMPLFVRQGAVIPTASQAMQSTQDFDPTQLTLHVFSTNRSHHNLQEQYWDNGEDAQALQNGAYEMLSYHLQEEVASLRLNFAQSQTWDGAPKGRMVTVVIHGNKGKPEQVSWKGKTLYEAANAHNMTDGFFHYDTATTNLTVQFFWNHEPGQLEIDR